MFISRLLSLAINIVTVHEEKKTQYYTTNLCMQYYPCLKCPIETYEITQKLRRLLIIPWKLSWYNTKKIMVLSLDLASLIIKLLIVIKLLVSGMATHSHKSVWSWCAMCSHIQRVNTRVIRGVYIRCRVEEIFMRWIVEKDIILSQLLNCFLLLSFSAF